MEPSTHARPRRRGLAARAPLALAATLAALGACSPSTGQVERAIEKELQRVVGPAARYDVDIDGLRAGDGEADRLRAVGERVRRDDAPAVDRLELELTGVRYDRDDKRLERLEGARATATLLPTDVADYLEARGGVDDADVRFEAPDRALLRLRPDLGGFPLPGGAVAEVEGRLTGDGSYLRFEVTDVRAGGFALGDRGLRTVTGFINPLLDLSEIPIPLEVTDVRVEDGRLRVDAVGGPVSVQD